MTQFLDKMLVKSPRYSQHSLNHTNKFTTRLGAVTPVYVRETAPGERVGFDVTHLTRLAPMLAPVMDSFRVNIDCGFVPSRILKDNVKYGIDFEKFHNPATPNGSRPVYPKENLLSMYIGACQASSNGDAIGTLYDYMGFPTFEAFDKYLREFKFTPEYGATPSTTDATNVFNWSGFFTSNSEGRVFMYPKMHGTLSVFGESTNMYDVFGTVPFSPIGYALYLYYNCSRASDIKSLIYINNKLVSNAFKDIQNFDSVLQTLGLTSSQFYAKYISYLKESALVYSFGSFAEPLMVNVAPLLAYWRFISDYYLNTNIDGDGDDFYSSVDFSRLDGKYMKLFDRRYPNDVFTSAFASQQSGTAVPIPVNGNIMDLRTANELQKFKEKVLYAGKRYVDNLLSIFGVKSSNGRLDKSIALGRETSSVQIEAVTQTNQAEISSMLESPLGSLVGQGVSYNKHYKNLDYTPEEHGFLIYMYSISPKASYFQGIPRMFLKTDYFDFLIPNFDKVGEQDVKTAELFLDPVQNGLSLDSNGVPNEIFGYNRRYYEYITANDEVHGQFRSSMDYWNVARKFDEKPTLSAEFIGIDPEHSNLNRIFTLTDGGEQTIYVMLNFSGSVVTPVSKYLNYDL